MWEANAWGADTWGDDTWDGMGSASGSGNAAEPGHRLTVMLVTALRRFVGARRRRGR